MTASLRSYLATLGTALTPEMVDATQRAFAERVAPLRPDVLVSRDHAYGPDARHRLDIFSGFSGSSDGPPRAASAPVLAFVHGGGFIMGDRRLPDLPFYDNVGEFAVRSGYIGVNITYRLAPAHRWPAGAQDVALAMGWLRENIAAYGGDPARIFLMGQSAGAVHVAGALTAARPSLSVAGALLISGMYDLAQTPANPLLAAYFGEDQSAWAACSTLEALATSSLPLLCSVSELDSPEFQRQAARMVAATIAARGRYPRMHWLTGHNHVSPLLSLGLGMPLDPLGPLIQQFIAEAQVAANATP